MGVWCAAVTVHVNMWELLVKLPELRISEEVAIRI
jgi:hypothetical protein